MTTHVCHTLEEAAEKLALSETVLVRLSQYFKTPRAAYEASGYLSFKGDLAFSEQDLAFFSQIKERLLAGETLDAVKSRLQASLSIPVSIPVPATGATTGSEAIFSPPLPADRVLPEDDLPPMLEIQDNRPYEKAVEESFERYKSMHRPGLGRVFENLLKEIRGVSRARGSQEAPWVSPSAPMRIEGEETRQGVETEGALQAMMRRNREATPPTKAERQETPAPVEEAAPLNPAWAQVMSQAVSQPRVVSAALQVAALRLKERALEAQAHNLASQRTVKKRSR